jgi:hypothetical protein
MEYEYGEPQWNDIDRGKDRKTLLPTSAVRGWRLTTSAPVRPYFFAFITITTGTNASTCFAYVIFVTYIIYTLQIKIIH